MKAMVLIGSRRMELQEIPLPRLCPQGILLRMEAAAICNATDYRSYAAEDPTQRWPNLPWPVVLGHELAGCVIQVGKEVSNLKEGDRLVHWGISHGAFAEYCAVLPNEVATFRVPKNVPSHEAVLLEVAMGAIRYLVSEKGDLLLKQGDRVMVAGLGPSGLIFLQYARLAGVAEIWVADHNKPRVEMARGLGATRVFSSVEELTRVAQSEGVTMDVMIDCTGSDLHAFFARLLRSEGLIVPYGSGCDWVALKRMLGDKPFRKAEGDVEEIRKALPLLTTWVEVGALQLAPLVSRRVPLEETGCWLEALQKRPKNLVKVVLKA